MSADEELSNSDAVRSYIQKHFDEKIDLSVGSNRTNMIKNFKKENPDMKSGTIDALFSREIPKVGKAYNFNKEDLTKKSPVKYDKKKLGTEIIKKESDIKTIGNVGIKNPELNPASKEYQFDQTKKIQYRYEIKDTQVKAFCESVYGLFQLAAKDLEDFTESEADDLGDLWQPLVQEKFGNSAKGQAALAVGGTSGILIKKVKKAKSKRKIRLEQEAKDKKSETPNDEVIKKIDTEKQ